MMLGVLPRHAGFGSFRSASHGPLSASYRHLSTSLPRLVPLLISAEDFSKMPKSSRVPLDVSWHMPSSQRSALAEYLSGPRIPGARRFDLDEVAELSPKANPLSLTHMLPSPETFEAACRKMGIGNDSHVVVYDTIGIFSSPRALWTFKALGHDKVSVLDGGLPRYIHEGYDVQMGDVGNFDEADYHGVKDQSGEWVRSYDQVVSNSSKPLSDPASDVVLDHRPTARWEGSAPEPRPGLSSGHIPNSLPAPFAAYLAPADDKTPYTSYKSVSELKQVLVNAVGGDEVWTALEKGDRAVVFSCGSGMTAAIGWLANELVKEAEGRAAQKTALYDESWTGYAMRKESKIVKGSQP